jgi:hypothetical protein
VLLRECDAHSKLAKRALGSVTSAPKIAERAKKLPRLRRRVQGQRSTLTITTAVITVASYTNNSFHSSPSIEPHSHSTPHHIITMFPRRFAQSMQAAAKQSSAAPARIQRAAFVSQQFTPAVSQRLSGMRMYSDAPAAEAKKTEEASADKDAKDAKPEEDPVKAELETKKKELLEATVRLYH